MRGVYSHVVNGFLFSRWDDLRRDNAEGELRSVFTHD